MKILFLFLAFLSYNMYCQEDTGYVYQDLKKALEHPEKVYQLDLNCQHLSALDLHQLSKFENLVRLNLSCTWLKHFPKSILACRKLKYLDIENNDLKKIPAEISELSALETFNIGYNLFDSLPVSLFKLQHLKKLDLSANYQLKLPVDLINLQSLEELNCYCSAVEFSEVICKIPTLKKISVESKDFISPCLLLSLPLLEDYSLSWHKPARFKPEMFDCSLVSMPNLREVSIYYMDYCCPYLKLTDGEIAQVKSLLPPGCEFSGYYIEEELRSDIELR
jgi:hypothetical protein